MSEQIISDCEKSSSESLNRVVKKTHAKFDMAVLLTLATGALYILGWAYWAQYFRYFGIDSSFIDLSFHQIIATTWVFAYSFGIIIFALLDYSNHEFSDRVSISVYNLLLVMVGLLSGISFALSIPVWSKIAIAIGLFILLMASKPKLKALKINMARILSWQYGKIIMLILLLSLAMLFNIQLGTHHAKEKSKLNSEAERITLRVKERIGSGFQDDKFTYSLSIRGSVFSTCSNWRQLLSNLVTRN